MTSTYSKALDDGRYEYGTIVVVDQNDRRKDRMVPVGWTDTFEAAEQKRLGLELVKGEGGGDIIMGDQPPDSLPDSQITLNPGEPMLDITGAGAVQIQITRSKDRVWVNVDGICRLRVCRIKGPVEVDRG
jgi:hypothetical protein